MNESLIETPRFNYIKEIEEIEVSANKTPTQKRSKIIDVLTSNKKKCKCSKSPKSSKLNSKKYRKLKKKHKANSTDEITIFEFLFKKFKLGNEYDEYHTNIFLKEKEKAFEGYPKSDKIEK